MVMVAVAVVDGDDDWLGGQLALVGDGEGEIVEVDCRIVILSAR